jgi:hypothetical protein
MPDQPATSFDEFDESSEILQIDSILRDPSFQVRRRLDQGTVERYANTYRAGVDMPPVQVGRIKGTLVLLDGWHRLAALDQIGRNYVQACVRDMGEREAAWIAASANLAHGLPLKSSEIRAVFRQYILARKHINKDGSLRSYREIAADLGGMRSYSTIRNWMRDDFPRIFEKYGGDESRAADGGLRDEDRIQVIRHTARSSVNQALAAYSALENPEDRAEVAQLFRAALERIEAGDSSEPVDYESDF